jgi:hypothetical protein
MGCAPTFESFFSIRYLDIPTRRFPPPFVLNNLVGYPFILTISVVARQPLELRYRHAFLYAVAALHPPEGSGQASHQPALELIGGLPSRHQGFEQMFEFGRVFS